MQSRCDGGATTATAAEIPLPGMRLSEGVCPDEEADARVWHCSRGAFVYTSPETGRYPNDSPSRLTCRVTTPRPPGQSEAGRRLKPVTGICARRSFQGADGDLAAAGIAAAPRRPIERLGDSLPQ
jgi:hypothetical protein